METIGMEACDHVGGGLSPLDSLRALGWIYSVGEALVNSVGYLGGTLRNYYGEDAALEAFRGGNLGA